MQSYLKIHFFLKYSFITYTNVFLKMYIHKMDIMDSCPVISGKLIEALFWQQKLWYKTWSFETILQNLQKDEGIFLRQIPNFHKSLGVSLSCGRHLGWVLIERQLRSGTDELPDLSRTMYIEKEEMAPAFNLVKLQPWIQVVFGAQTSGSWRVASRDYCDIFFFFSPQGISFFISLGHVKDFR